MAAKRPKQNKVDMAAQSFTDAQYASVPERARLEGALDKCILMDCIASGLTRDREFNEFVLQKVSNAANGGDAQAAAWFAFVASLPYRREHGEIYRYWKEVVQHGGDCDDLVNILVGGLLCLALPAFTQILTDELGWAFHCRAVVGLPPHAPTSWLVLDPVWQSEREWAMADVAMPTVMQSPEQAVTTVQSTGTEPKSSIPSWWGRALLFALGFAVGRSTKNSRAPL